MTTSALVQKSLPPIAVKSDQFVWVRSPVRLDLAGGWTDTPPYTLQYGGKVVNLAVNLNGQPPVQVYVRKTPELRVRMQSIDLGLREDFSQFEDLEGYQIPSSSFALVKGALALLGLTSQTSGYENLDGLLRAIGGGMEITVFVAVPKGSGLGTSSILAGTILGALHRFFGRHASVEQLTVEVLRLEQMMTTGGGWQDQVGGIEGGVKFTESQPGDNLNFCVEYLDDFLLSGRGSAACCTLYYTGITRLAKNILDEVVARVKSKDAAYLDLHNRLKGLAERTRAAISRRNLHQLADVVAESWEANKRIHASVTNDEVEELLRLTRPHYRGAKLLGAGGGGYCLFISENPAQAARLRQALGAIDHDSARIVDFSLNTEGLQVSVS
jgi:galactokinase/mevalonate kinase-like predicted kinase